MARLPIDIRAMLLKSGKEDLFAALVEPMLRGFQNMYREVISQELSDLSTGTDNELTSITYAVAHKDEFRLLFECSGGTKSQKNDCSADRLLGSRISKAD